MYIHAWLPFFNIIESTCIVRRTYRKISRLYLLNITNKLKNLSTDFKYSFIIIFLPNPTYYSFFTLRRVLIMA